MSLFELEAQSRKAWLEDLSYFKLPVAILLRENSYSKLDRLVRTYLGEETVEFHNLTYNRLRRFLRSCRTPRQSLIQSMKIGFALQVQLEKMNKIRRVNRLLEGIARNRFPDNHLLSGLESHRMKNSDNFYPYQVWEPIQEGNERIVTLENVRICGVGLIMDSDDVIQIPDPAADPKSKFVAGHWNRISSAPGKTKARFLGNLQWTAAIKVIEEGIDLTGRISGNYWHSLIEYVPRLLAISDLRERVLIVSKSTPGTVIEAIRFLAPTSEILLIDDGEWIRVRRLVVPRFASRTYDSGVHSAQDMFSIKPEVLMEISNKLKIASLSDDGVPKRVFLERNSNFRQPRKMVKLREFLQDEGFLSLDPAELSFQQQMQVFSKAKVIVSFGGAVWANLIFANPNSKYISLTSVSSIAFDMHAEIAKILGLNYQAIGSKSKVPFPERNNYYRFYCHHSIGIDDDVIHQLSTAIQ
jgi:hypothetical protein